MDADKICALSDGELERLAAAGDTDAFGELYERYSNRLYDYLVRIVRNPDDAADLMQETFVRALGALSPSRVGTARFSTWLYKIAHNLAVSRLERNARMVPLVPSDDEDVPRRYHDVNAVEAPDVAAEARELSALVWEAAEALDARQYSLLDLHVRQGLDSGEIADVLGVSKGNAYTMLSRLRQTFESAVAAVVISRQARGKCRELDKVLREHGAPQLTPALRKTIEEHTATCETCSAERQRLVSATALLRAVPLLPLPLLVKERVRAAVAETISAHAASLVQGASVTAHQASVPHVMREWRSSLKGILVAAIAVASAFLPATPALSATVPQPLSDVAGAETGPPAGPPSVAAPAARSPTPAPAVAAVVSGPPPVGQPAAGAVVTRTGSVAVPASHPPPLSAPPGTVAPWVPVVTPLEPSPAPDPRPPEGAEDVRGIPHKNPSHAPAGEGSCGQRQTEVKETPAGTKVNVPCHAEKSKRG
ncbi:MAG: sigma-70 family RNA polymerase sigma factor [Chloroflexota bacterium]|nr:sigma-70 family RNA polymerase sigma factor [Chloroflexota bacterium]